MISFRCDQCRREIKNGSEMVSLLAFPRVGTAQELFSGVNQEMGDLCSICFSKLFEEVNFNRAIEKRKKK